MKYIILGLLLTSCTAFLPKPPNRNGRVMNCVDRFVDKGVDAEIAFKECKSLFGRKR